MGSEDGWGDLYSLIKGSGVKEYKESWEGKIIISTVDLSTRLKEVTQSLT